MSSVVDDDSSSSSRATYFYSKFKKPDSQHTVKRYYKFVEDSSGRRRKSVWVTKAEAEKHGAKERGEVREMRPSKPAERLAATQQYVGFIQEQVKTRSKSGRLRTMTRAVGKDGKLYKITEDEAKKSGLPIEAKEVGMQLWYVSSGRKYKKNNHIQKVQQDFHRLHKLRAKQRKAGALSYDLDTYTLGDRSEIVGARSRSSASDDKSAAAVAAAPPPKMSVRKVLRGTLSDLESEEEDFYSNRHLDSIFNAQESEDDGVRKLLNRHDEDDEPRRRQQQRIRIHHQIPTKTTTTAATTNRRRRRDYSKLNSSSDPDSDLDSDSDSDSDLSEDSNYNSNSNSEDSDYESDKDRSSVPPRHRVYLARGLKRPDF